MSSRGDRAQTLGKPLEQKPDLMEEVVERPSPTPGGRLARATHLSGAVRTLSGTTAEPQEEEALVLTWK